MPDDKSLCIAVVTGAHGVHGNLRLKAFTQDPLAILGYKAMKTEAGESYKVKNARVHKADSIIVKFEDVTTRDKAEAMKGTKLYIQRSELPDLEEEEFYHADLVGLKVHDLSGKCIGNVTALHNFGAGDLLEIVIGENSDPQMISFTKVYVPEINIKAGHVVVDMTQVSLDEDAAAVEEIA